MYAANPFLAQQEKRQAAEKCEEATGLNSTSVDARKEASSNEFLQSPEVKMATFLRELVEGAIREASYKFSSSKKIYTKLRPRNSPLTQVLLGVATYSQHFPKRKSPSFLRNWGVLVSIGPKYKVQKYFWVKAPPYPSNYLVL